MLTSADNNSVPAIFTKNDILMDVKTHDRAVVLIKLLEELSSLTFADNQERSVSLIHSLKGEFPYTYSYVFPKNSTDLGSISPNLSSIDAIIDTLRNFEVIDMSLAFFPNEAFILTVFQWFKTNTNLESLIRFSVDKSLLGGYKIAYKGKYLDYSLESLCTDLFINQKNEILSILQK